MSEVEGVAVNQLINVAIAEKVAQLRTAKWFAERISAADPKAGAALIRDMKRGGGKKPRKGDAVLAPRKKSRRVGG